MNLLLPLILIASSVGVFLGYIDPTYKYIREEQKVLDQSNAVIDLSQELNTTKDQLNSKNNEITDEQRKKLKEALPDNADNVRMIIEIENIADKHNVGVKDVIVKTDSQKTNTASPQPVLGGAPPADPYGILNVDFIFSASYENFLAFIEDLETSQRFIDVASIKFAAPEAGTGVYDFNVSVNGYWLK